MRVLVWFLLAFIVYLALRKKFISNLKSTHSNGSFASPPAANEAGEAMLACAHCQVFIPASEAVFRNEIAYCSVEHADVSR